VSTIASALVRYVAAPFYVDSNLLPCFVIMIRWPWYNFAPKYNQLICWW